MAYIHKYPQTHTHPGRYAFGSIGSHAGPPTLGTPPPLHPAPMVLVGKGLPSMIISSNARPPLPSCSCSPWPTPQLGPKHLMGKGTSHALHLYTVVDVWLWLHTCFPVTFIVACTTCGDMVMQTTSARSSAGI